MHARETRRRFLLQLARGAVFVPPAVRTYNLALFQGQGLSPTPSCPPGYRYDKKTGQCVPTSGKGGVAPASGQGAPPNTTGRTPPWQRPPPGGEPGED